MNYSNPLLHVNILWFETSLFLVCLNKITEIWSRRLEWKTKRCWSALGSDQNTYHFKTNLSIQGGSIVLKQQTTLKHIQELRGGFMGFGLSLLLPWQKKWTTNDLVILDGLFQIRHGDKKGMALKRRSVDMCRSRLSICVVDFFFLSHTRCSFQLVYTRSSLHTRYSWNTEL